ncbi:MAG: alpha-amylase family glycosyl hydrolase, partial [Flammeovirgaceae bacterium]|nr:alpha-amylase family glycosyl hydrolase [Flammeovirgaceae bacterium]MDW8288392.1 alpha-amylase family glycosyl hydrolase [Flammeovirgaceae bacterium]
VKEADVDGFRCDVAGFVPTNFWIHVRKKLDAIKPVFMLAEWESRDMHQAFDMTYAWRLWDIMHQIAKGYKNAGSLSYYFTEEFNAMPLHNIRMNFIENHDKNSWEGTVGANFGKAEQTFIVLTCLAQGMPLIYSGQEAGLNKPLAFFEKDLIPWQEHPNRQLFQELLSLKKSQKALWNGEWGGAMLPVNNSHPEKIAVFVREKENNRVVIILNCSNEKVSFTIQDKSIEGSYTDAFAKTEVTVYKDVPLTLEAWKYLVLIQ